MFLQSKCGIIPGKMYDASKEHILRSAVGSLERLQTDHLDMLLLHRPDALIEPEEVADKYGVTKTMIATAWILRHPAKMQMIAGTTKLTRMKEIINRY